MANLKYFIFNSKILPVNENPTKRYKTIIEKWYKKGYRIQTSGDNQHYYVLITLNIIGAGIAYYGVVAKFVKWETLDFVDEKGELVEFEIPENVQARMNEYEFIFVPECHRFAFITNGKIDPKIKRHGAPLQKMNEIIEKAFSSLTEYDVYVDVEQSDQIFEKIFSSEVNYLEAKISFTNNDISEEGKKHFDDLMREADVTEFFTRMKPPGNGAIDTSKELPKEIIELAQSNGYVKARITEEDGTTDTINTRNHPRKEEVSMVSDEELERIENSSQISADGSRFIVMSRRIYRQLMTIFR